MCVRLCVRARVRWSKLGQSHNGRGIRISIKGWRPVALSQNQPALGPVGVAVCALRPPEYTRIRTFTNIHCPADRQEGRRTGRPTDRPTALRAQPWSCRVVILSGGLCQARVPRPTGRVPCGPERRRGRRRRKEERARRPRRVAARGSGERPFSRRACPRPPPAGPRTGAGAVGR